MGWKLLIRNCFMQYYNFVHKLNSRLWMETYEEGLDLMHQRNKHLAISSLVFELPFLVWHRCQRVIMVKWISLL